MKVCIETLLTLGSRELNHDSDSLDWFVEVLARNHNFCTGSAYPSMSKQLRDEIEDDDYWGWPYLEWSITDKRYMIDDESPCKALSFQAGARLPKWVISDELSQGAAF